METSKIIIPECPFEKYRKGYISINKENRRIIQLYANAETRKTISYARYRMSVLIGRELTDDEEADHKDNDHTNDSDSNLQILSKEKNLLKQAELQKVPLVVFHCAECSGSFTLLPSEYKRRSDNYKRDPYCSHSCSSRAAIKEGRSPSISDLTNNAVEFEKIRKILELKNLGKSLRQIGSDVGISSSTVDYHLKRHWKCKSIGDENGLENRRALIAP